MGMKNSRTSVFFFLDQSRNSLLVLWIRWKYRDCFKIWLESVDLCASSYYLACSVEVYLKTALIALTLDAIKQMFCSLIFLIIAMTYDQPFKKCKLLSLLVYVCVASIPENLLFNITFWTLESFHSTSANIHYITQSGIGLPSKQQSLKTHTHNIPNPLFRTSRKWNETN